MGSNLGRDRSGGAAVSSYTLRELEDETGFGCRTIAYYIQEGLLPKVGRRGPRTRYPALFRHRLFFVRRVREAEEAGRIPPVTLKTLGEFFAAAPEELVLGVADRRVPVTPDLFPEMPEGRGYPPRWSEWKTARREGGFIRLQTDVRSESRSPPRRREPVPHYRSTPARRGEPTADAEDDVARMPAPPADGEADDAVNELAELLNDLALLQRLAEGRIRRSPEEEVWLHVGVTPDISLTVRGLGKSKLRLMEKIARRLRGLLPR